MPGIIETDGYVLERTEAEHQRLRAQAQVWEPTTRRVLESAGLAPGMRCLDAGCGPGEVMRLMGRIVGSEGHVTGLDIDATLGAHMLAELRREEGPQFGFVAADLMRGDAIPGAAFDVVFARHLLIHMTDPVAAVRRLAALARPGGRLVLMDFDLSRLACRPEHPALARAFEIVTACFRRSGKDPDCGLQLAHYLEAAGLPTPAESIAETSFAPIARLGPMVRSVLASLAPAAQALGVAEPAEITGLQAEIAGLEAANRHFALGPLMVGVWTTGP
jgi:SAM-dependent methyltransferase